MLELFKIRARDDISLTRFKELAAPLLKEYFIPLIPKKNILAITRFLDEKIVAKEIKENRYQYYFISLHSKYIGFLEMKQRDDFLNISRFYLKKEFRRQGIGRQVLEELIKNEAQKLNLKKIRICIEEEAPITAKIFKRLGFKPTKKISRYIGDGAYLYEYIYFYNLN